MFRPAIEYVDGGDGSSNLEDYQTELIVKFVKFGNEFVADVMK